MKSTVNNKNVARFYYKGNHSHPVRREVIVVEDNLVNLIGYEVREGNVVRDFKHGLPLKSYRKNNIATYGSYCRLRASKANRRKPKNLTTLSYVALNALFKD